jgi:hypothetical protein
MNNNTYIEYDTEQMEMISLYDYLGRAAGSTLGKQVYEEACNRNVPVQSKDIVTKYYNGPVLLYPTSFLKEYFKDNKK